MKEHTSRLPRAGAVGARHTVDHGVRCERAWYFAGDREIGPSGANFRAESAVFELTR